MWTRILTVGWVTQLITHYFLWFDLELPIGILWSAISLLLAVVIIITEGIQYFRTKKKKPIGIIVISTAYVLSAITPIGPEIGAYFKFKRHFHEYNEIVQSVIKGEGNLCNWPECKVDNGPPIRVAFSWGGLIDNWSGICYDPSGEISHANSSYHSPTRGLFEGDLIYAFHLTGYWFYCGFT